MSFRRKHTYELDGRQVYREQIIVPARFGATEPAAWSDCVLDTGAFLSIIPVWLRDSCKPDIRWVEGQIAEDLPDWLKSFGGVAGGRVESRVGYIGIKLYDISYRHFVATEILALFPKRDDVAITPLLGLSGGLLDPFVLHIDYAATSAWLEVKA